MVMSCATLGDWPHVGCDAKLDAAGCRLRFTKISSATWCAVEPCRLRLSRLVEMKLDVECDNQGLENVWLRSCATSEVVVCDLEHPNST